MERIGVRARATGALGILLCLCVVSAELQSVAHHLTVRHVFCGDHGHVVDVERWHVGAAVLGNAGDGLQPGPASPDTDHHHCANELFMRSVLREPAAILPSVTVALTDIRSTGNQVARQPIALLRLAPKSSPPASI